MSRRAGPARTSRQVRATIGEMRHDQSDAPNDDDPGTAARAPEDRDASSSGTDDPRESVYGLLQRGHDLIKGRHHAQAATVLERAAQLEPGMGSILEALGRACYNSGQHARSADAFERLLEVDPSAHYAHYALGQSLKQLGRLREARTHLRLAVALSPNSRLYGAALARLGPAPEKPKLES